MQQDNAIHEEICRFIIEAADRHNIPVIDMASLVLKDAKAMSIVLRVQQVLHNPANKAGRQGGQPS